MGYLWVIGVALGVLAALAGSCGKVLMKFAHNLGLNSTEKVRGWGAKHLLAAGLFLNVAVNPALFIAAYAFASQTLIVPLSGLVIVFNTMLAPTYLEEKLTSMDVAGTTVACVGVILVAVAGDKSDQDFELKDMFDLYSRKTFIYYAVIDGGVMVLAVLTLHLSSFFSKDSIVTKLSYGSLGGMIGGQHFLMKGATVVFDEGSFLDYRCYLVVIGAAGTALTGLVMLNAGLKRYDAVFIVPSYESFLILTGSVSGMIFWEEYKNMKGWQWYVFFY